MGAVIVAVIVVVIVVFVVWKSFHSVGATEVGLVGKRFAFRKLDEDNPIAFRGEAGYQATMLMPGLRFKLWPLFGVKKFPWVQVPAGEIGVVIAQVGAPLPIGAKSAVYKAELANFSNLHTFIEAGGQKGVQRPVLPPGTLVPVHPVAFLVLTPQTVYGLPVSPDLASQAKGKTLTPESFGLSPDQLRVVVITPDVGGIDLVGVVTALEGEPLPSGDIASRLGGFEDVAAIEASNAGGSTSTTDAQLIDLLLGSKNNLHNNYQDFQAFLDNGGKIGLQHDTLLYGAYLLNPFLVRVDLVPMLVVDQGEVAVIKGFVGLPTDDTSGAEFKFGSIVRPGHRGIWQEPLRTGKYAINPRVYAAEIVPTFILTLNWADATSEAHDLDAQLSSIVGKSREGFIFQIDLQVQIHVPDTKAPKVISMVGTMRNLVSEVLQSAVGNHFRNTLQALEAVKFIETRREVQAAAFEAITRYLSQYEVETKGVYIQDVAFPESLVVVLTQREIANQEKSTFEEQQRAETSRIEMEKAKGTANMQSQLAGAQVGVQIKTNEAQAREAEARGEAAYVQLTGEAEAARRQAIGLAEAKATEALGLARATGFEAQKDALGGPATAVVAVANAVADGHITVVPEVLVTGGGGGSVDGLAATLMRYLGTNGSGAGNAKPTAERPAGLPTPVETAEVTRDESEGALGTERSDEQRDVTS
ncbi:MAG TPA: SPFH domain-containing protein [Acidimicrobiia bacterium]|jgi:regulator of protease activity HflC (stomatin/prohibitin superfamily)|nr:SPFH domain-containing protein [Acidimicrobiia bacterium]